MIAGVSLCVYGRALSRYFVSEDFPILRILSEGSLFENTWRHLTGPWLGITFVPFYRPISTLVLDLELRLWGTEPAGYLVTHFMVHLVNVGLLHGVVRRLTGADSIVPFAAAWLFALYPLQPNAVLFIGSFATLFAATAGLGSLWLLLRARGDGARRRDLVAAWAGFAAALGSYESAVMLPGILLAAEVLFPGTPDGRVEWRSVVRRQVPFAVILVVYLGVRCLALGSLGGQLEALWPSLYRLNWPRFLYPMFDLRLSGTVRWGVAIAMAGITLGSLLAVVRPSGSSRDGSRDARLWLLAVVWVVLAQLPFGTSDVLPGTGRFWYFSSAALGLLVAAGVGRLAPPRRRSRMILLFALTLGIGYLPRLFAHVATHVEAGEQSRSIQTRLRDYVLATDPDRRYFVTGHPEAMKQRRTAVAQVYHWGLDDALGPPFLDRPLRIYPLGDWPRDRLVPLFGRPDLGEVVRLLDFWIGDAAPVPATESTPIRILRPAADGELPEDGRIVFEASPVRGYCMVVLTRGNPVRPTVTGVPPGARRIEGQLPLPYIESMRRLYRDEIFWWIEGFDDEDRPVSFSELRTIPRLAPPSPTPRSARGRPAPR